VLFKFWESEVLSKYGAAAVAGATVGLLATSVSANVVDVVIAQGVAKQQAAEHEAACQAGAPASDGEIKAVTARTERLMDSYLGLTPTSDARALYHVFASRTPGVRWRDGQGVVPIEQLGEHLASPSATPVLKDIVVGGDGESSRSTWTVTPAGAEAPTLVYAVDVLREDGHPFDWALGYRILHMTVTMPSGAPPPPAAYCNLDFDHGY
jgi:hypothetical protein